MQLQRGLFIAVIVQLMATLAGRAQIQVHVHRDGDWLPVSSANHDSVFVTKDGKQKKAWMGVKILPSESFGEGLVQIDKVQVDQDPLRALSAKERSKPGCIAFRYTAVVTSTTDLQDCYAVLIYQAKGSVGSFLQPLGRLSAGDHKSIKVELQNRVDVVGHLHIFSRALELRSNQVPAAYEARAYLASLERSSDSVSAVELCYTDRKFPLSLSRDGRLLAVAHDRSTHVAVVVYDLVSMQPLCEVPTDKEYKEVRDLTWVSDKEVAFISGDEELMTLDLEKRECAVMNKKVSHILMGVRDRPGIVAIVCLEGYTTLFDVHKRRAAAWDWDSLETGTTVFDATGHPRLRYSYEGDTKEYFCRRSKNGRWVSLDDTVQQPGLRFSIRGDDFLNQKVIVDGVSVDGDTLYVSTRLDSDTYQLATYSISKGVITQILAKHPKYDLADDDYSNFRLLFHRATSQLIGMVYDGEKPQVVWWDAGFAVAQKVMEQAFPGQAVLPLDWANDGSTIIYFVYSDRNCGAYYTFRPLEAKAVKLFDQGESLEGKKLARTEPMDFKARDGATIHAYLTRPPTPVAGLLPLVVDIHGGPTVRDLWGFNVTNQFLATRGYAVLRVNFRGSSGYGAAYQRAGLQARLDTVVIDDIADGVRQLISDGAVDPERIAVMGGSFGGWATYMSLIKYPDLYRAGVAISAVSHFRSQLREMKRIYGRDYDYAYAFWQDILGKADFAKNEKFTDPLLRVAEIHQPVYIMHGGEDWVVHASQAGDMLKALQKTNPIVRSKNFPRAGHSYSSWPLEDTVVRLNELEDFFSSYLKPTAPASSTQTPSSSP